MRKTNEIYYKGFYIYRYCDTGECRIGGTISAHKSLHAAKCHITKALIPAHDKAMCQFAGVTK